MDDAHVEALGLECGILDAARRYAIHFTLSNDVIYSVDRSYVVTSVSPSIERVLGYKPEEILHRPIYELDLIPDRDIEKALCEIDSVLRGDKIISSVSTFITKDGRVRYAEVSGVPYVVGGKPIEVVSVARDITERVEMERTLRQSEGRFRAVFESARDCIFIKDAGLRYTFVNPCMENLLGIPSKDIMGKTDSELFGPEVAEGVCSVDRRVLQGEEVEHECVWKVPSGEMILHIVRVPIRNGASITGLCGIARDITERKRSAERILAKEQELAIQARRLEEMNIALKVLLDTREREKRQALELITTRIRSIIVPYLEMLGQALRDEGAAEILMALSSSLEEILEGRTSPYTRLLSLFTPMEQRVANLIRMGKSTKEIASILGISTHAVSFHRGNIRKKCGLVHARRNLRLYLLSVEERAEMPGAT